MKGLLLDTHVVLWWRSKPDAFDEALAKRIRSTQLVLVSAASAWEVAIKCALGRLEIPEPFSRGVADSGFEELPVRFVHAEEAAALPRHHGDPFDRMLVAQARIENLVLVSRDPAMERYDLDLLMI